METPILSSYPGYNNRNNRLKSKVFEPMKFKRKSDLSTTFTGKLFDHYSQKYSPNVKTPGLQQVWKRNNEWFKKIVSIIRTCCINVDKSEKNCALLSISHSCQSRFHKSANDWIIFVIAYAGIEPSFKALSIMLRQNFNYGFN